MVKTKICGITNLEDARASIRAGCDALGFVFYKKSPRYILPLKASRIIKALPMQTIKIGVFVNARQSTVRKIAKLCHLDMLQFHGNESPGFCEQFKRYKIIKAFRIKDKVSLRNIMKYKTFAYLFDTFVKSLPGGTGKRFNWNFLSSLDTIKRLVFLSGGLTKTNVRQAIASVRPQWVDVSSAVEVRPGKKDHKKIKEFIQATKK